MADNLIERFRDKFMVHPRTKCWVWTGARIPGGYGMIGCAFGKKNDVAHRVSYMLHVGPIPAGLNLDHLCRNRYCVNPDHLEPVTHAENVRRGLSPSIIDAKNKAFQAAKTHCPHGHPYSGDNLYISNTRGLLRRHCRACGKRRNIERAERKKCSA